MAMSTRELKARDERKDSLLLTLASTLVGSFLVGTLLWWPGAAITVILGVFVTSQVLRQAS